MHPAALLTAEQSQATDQAAITAGVTGAALMEKAGKAVMDVISQKYTSCPILVVCGTGNNGGDGFVVASLLKERGWPVTLCVAGDTAEIKGDAKTAKDKWNRSG